MINCGCGSPCVMFHMCKCLLQAVPCWLSTGASRTPRRQYSCTLKLSRFEGRDLMVEGSRLSSPFQGESRYSTIQKKHTGLTIPQWIDSQLISCHSMASDASHTNGYQQFLSIILVISILCIGSADRSLELLRLPRNSMCDQTTAHASVLR